MRVSRFGEVACVVDAIAAAIEQAIAPTYRRLIFAIVEVACKAPILPRKVGK